MINGNKIVKIREQLGLSHEDLAQSLHVSIETLKLWEQGSVEPSQKEIELLCDALKIQPGEISDAQETKTSRVEVLDDQDVDTIVEKDYRFIRYACTTLTFLLLSAITTINFSQLDTAFKARYSDYENLRMFQIDQSILYYMSDKHIAYLNLLRGLRTLFAFLSVAFTFVLIISFYNLVKSYRRKDRRLLDGSHMMSENRNLMLINEYELKIKSYNFDRTIGIVFMILSFVLPIVMFQILYGTYEISGVLYLFSQDLLMHLGFDTMTLLIVRACTSIARMMLSIGISMIVYSISMKKNYTKYINLFK